MNRYTRALVLLGFALRLFLIFPGPLESKVEFFTNKADLRNYYWPAQTALRGENPYALWASGAAGEFRADLAPLELATFVATVAVWNDARALQILFALFDALNIILLGALLQRSRLRVPFQLFYALGPLTIYNLTLVPQDKTILLTLTFTMLYLLVRHPERVTGIVIVAALIASFKWLSVFYLVPLFLHLARAARAFKSSAIFGGVVALAHLFWFPDWWVVYAFRSARVATPMHIAPASLLNAAGLFERAVLLVVLGASLAIIYVLYWRKRIDIFETIALSVMTGILWTPDMDPVHLSLIVIHFLLIVDWSTRTRALMVWGLSAWVAFVYAASTRTGFTRYGLPDFRIWVGTYGSPQMILLSYLLFIAIFTIYLRDKLRGRAVGKTVLVGS